MKKIHGILICLILIMVLTACRDMTSYSEPENEKVDYDLTVMSSTMVYSEVYNMMCYPEEYVGKTVRMMGTLADYYDEATGITYYACMIQDATACCSQGMEFSLAEGYTYPEHGSEICVEGIFETYIENGQLYCKLNDSKLL